jgi:stage IV sporulation protein FB
MVFRIDLKIFIFLVLFYFTKQIELYVIVMAFCLVHELGHLVAGLMLKMRPQKLSLTPFGIGISFKIKEQDYEKKIGKASILEIKKIVVALAGPLTNFIMIVAFAIFDIGIIDKSIAIYANILIAIFNLLPIYPLDGGRILNGILHIFLEDNLAGQMSGKITYVIMIIITMVGSIGVYLFENVAIFVIIVFLWCLVISPKEYVKE